MRILLAQTSFIGDCILSTPVIREIHELFTDAEIWVLTAGRGKEIFINHPLIKGVIAFSKNTKGTLQVIKKIRELKFDIVYSLHRSLRTALVLYLSKIPIRIGFSESKFSFLYSQTVDRVLNVHEVLRNISIIGKDNFKEHENYQLELIPPIRDKISPEILSQIQQKYLLMVPGSVWKTKQWNVHNYRQLAKLLLEAGFKVVIAGSKDETDICATVSSGLEVVDLSGKTSLEEMMFLIKYSSCLVCNDSMALHMGSAFSVPTVAIFCATSPSFGFGPWQNKKAAIVEKQGLWCKPCKRHGSNYCPSGSELCMRSVSAQEVYNMILKQI